LLKIRKPSQSPRMTSVRMTGSPNSRTTQSDTEDDKAEEEDDRKESSVVTETKKTSFADELAVKLGGNISVAPGTKKQSFDDKEDQKPPASALKKSTLFDSSDSDDDLFTAKRSLPPPLPKQANKPKPKLVATELESSVPDITPVQSVKKSVDEGKEEKPVFKPPIGGVSLFGNMNPKDVLKKKQKTGEIKADGSSEEEKSGNSLFENLLSKKKTVDPNTSAINSKSDDFLEEDDDDLFSPKSLVDDEANNEVASIEPPPMNSTPKKTKLDIFDEDSDDEDLFSDLLVKKTEAKSKAPDVSNLFGDDDDDDEFDDLFSSLIKK